MLIDDEEKKRRQEEFQNIVNTINNSNFNSETYENDIYSNNDISNQKEQEFFQMVNNINPIENNNINNLDTTESSIGNIDLNNRPVVKNGDGSISTVRSISIEEDGKEVLIPTVVNGKVVSDEEAIEHYHKTGEYLGKFNSVEEANAYAEQLHNQQEQLYSNNENNKKKVEILKGSKAFEDGYQFGDITKTAAGTVNDIVGDLVSGVASVGENVVDLGANIVATIQKWTGNKEASNKTKKWANTNYSEKLGNVVTNALPIGVLFNAMNGTLDWNLEKNDFEESSVLGETSDKVVNLVGYTAGLVAGTKGLDKLGSTISAAKGTETVAQLGNIPLKIGSKTLSLPTLAVVGGASRWVCRSQYKRRKCNRRRKVEQSYFRRIN